MLNFFALVLRVYCFLFHLTLSVFLISSVAIAHHQGHQLLPLDMLPFDSDVFLRDTLLLGLAGACCTLLALTRWFKIVFLVWTMIVVYLMIKWFFLGDYTFDNARQARGAVYLTLGSVGAFLGAWWSLRTRRRLPLF